MLLFFQPMSPRADERSCRKHGLCAKTASDEATQTIDWHPAMKHCATTVPRKTLPQGLLFVLRHPPLWKDFLDA